MIHEASSEKMRTGVLPSVGAGVGVQAAKRRVEKGRVAGHSGRAAIEATGWLMEHVTDGSRRDRHPTVLSTEGEIGCG